MWEQTQTLSFLLMELGWNDLISLQQDKHFQIKLKTDVRPSLSLIFVPDSLDPLSV